jgi:hypothetical protein
MDSYDIRFWDIKKNGNGSAARYRVRWSVDGREHCKSFKARPLADGFLTELKDAVRGRRPFSPRTGLPGSRARVGVGPGRGSGVSSGPFPRPALRTGRASLPASGAPRVPAG